MGRLSPSYRKRLFALHGWLGLHFGLWLCVVCLTGAIASLTEEIEWLTDPALRIQPLGPIQWQQTYETLTQTYPDAEVDGFRVGEATVLASLAWKSTVSYPDGRFGRTRVDPYQATIVRPRQLLTLTHFIRQLHYNVHSDLGFYLIGFLALPLFLSAVSGLLFYKNWWRSFLTLRTGQGWRVFWSSAHSCIGVWALLFALLMAITGIWYLTESFLAQDLVFPEGPTLSAKQLEAHGPTPKKLSLDQYIASAKRAFPELDPTGIGLPYSPDETVSVSGRTGGWLTRDRANTVYLDPYSGDVIAIRKHDDSELLTWWINSVDALHFGYWGGLAGKVVWCVLGLSLPVLMLSGAYLSFRRSGLIGGNRTTAHPDRRPLWQRIPLRSVITLVLFCAIVMTTTYSCELRRHVAAPQQHTLGSASIGPWAASLSRPATVNVGGTTPYSLRVEAGAGRTANFKKATLHLSDARLTPQPVEAIGQVHAMTAWAPTPEHGEKSVNMVLTIQTWDGTRHVAEFPDSWSAASHTSLNGELGPSERIPDTTPLSNTFVAVMTLFWVVTVIMGTVWLWFDRRLEAKQIL